MQGLVLFLCVGSSDETQVVSLGLGTISPAHNHSAERPFKSSRLFSHFLSSYYVEHPSSKCQSWEEACGLLQSGSPGIASHSKSHFDKVDLVLREIFVLTLQICDALSSHGHGPQTLFQTLVQRQGHTPYGCFSGRDGW